jgi:peroxiredoxin family protein
MSKPLVIYLHSDSYDRIYQAVNMLMTAASTGQNGYLFLFYHALGSFMAGAWDDAQLSPSSGEKSPWRDTLERSFELANLPSLYDLLDRAREADGTLAVYACSNSTQFLGLDPADVKKRADQIVGLATMLEISGNADQVLYL